MTSIIRNFILTKPFSSSINRSKFITATYVLFDSFIALRIGLELRENIKTIVHRDTSSLSPRKQEEEEKMNGRWTLEGWRRKGESRRLKAPFEGQNAFVPRVIRAIFRSRSAKTIQRRGGGGWMSGRRVGVRAWNRARVSRLPLVVETGLHACLYAHQTHVASRS